MEAYHGDLHTYVRSKGYLVEPLARTLFMQIAAAVCHCHHNAIVLRDMKLGKLMFGDAECTRVVVADMDGAQVLSRGESVLHDQRGSPAYVAPEVLACRPYDGPSADMWSLGVILYVLLSCS